MSITYSQQQPLDIGIEISSSVFKFTVLCFPQYPQEAPPQSDIKLESISLSLNSDDPLALNTHATPVTTKKKCSRNRLEQHTVEEKKMVYVISKSEQSADKLY